MKRIKILFVLIFIGCGNSTGLITSTDQHEEIQNNSVLEKGKYAEGRFEDCGPGGIELITYKYRIGEWIFHHPNGQVKAKGSYKPVIAKISTRCQEDENIKFSVPGDDWKLYDHLGKEVEPDEHLKALLGCVTQEEDELLDMKICYNSNENEVTQEVAQK